MTIIHCPWCEIEVALEGDQLAGAELGCPGCSSAWLLADPAAALPLAA